MTPERRSARCAIEDSGIPVRTRLSARWTRSHVSHINSRIRLMKRASARARSTKRAAASGLRLNALERRHRGSILRRTSIGIKHASPVYMNLGHLESRGDDLVPVQLVAYLPSDLSASICIDLANERTLVITRSQDGRYVDLRMDVAGDIVVLPRSGANVLRISDASLVAPRDGR